VKATAGRRTRVCGISSAHCNWTRLISTPYIYAAALTGYLGRAEEGVALGEYVAARDPVNALGQYRLGLNYLWAGQLDEAIASLRTALSLSPGRIGAQSAIGDALLRQGKPDAALAAIPLESDEAFRLIGLAQVPVQIEFTNIHDDPRWLPFLESIGKSSAQLDAIKFKVTLPE